MFNFIKSDIEDMRRLKKILSVFFEQGFGYIIDQTPLKDHIPYRKRIKKKLLTNSDKTFPVRLRIAFESLGPTFIKLGQILSLRPDLVPHEYIVEFEKMLDRVPTFPTEQAKKMIEKELKKPIKELFINFEDIPVASASLAQVHKATLHNGKKVAIKVQRPNIENLMKIDIEIMLYIATMIDKNFKKLDFHLATIIKEFQRWTEKELNFYFEALNAKRFRDNFKNSKNVYIPKVYKKYTTSRILTTEFLEGTPLSRLNDSNKSKKEIKKIIDNGFESTILQVFEYGLFHADPHPGNFIALKDNRVGIVDFGIVGEFDKQLKHKALRIFNAIMKNDFKQVTKSVLALDSRNSKINFPELERDLRYAIFPLQGGESLADVKVTGSIINVLNVALDHKVKVPIDFVLFGKTIVTAEGIALKYYPDFKIRKESIKIMEDMLDRNSFSKQFIDDIRSHSYDLLEIEDTLPDYTRDVLERIRSGKINIDIENKNISSFVNEMERSSGNLSFGLIISSLVIGSSLIFSLDKYKYLAITGYLLSVILGFYLIKRTVYLKRKV